MALLNPLTWGRPTTAIHESFTMDAASLNALAKRMGLAVHKDARGDLWSEPIELRGQSEKTDFYNFWMESILAPGSDDNARLERYHVFNLMDENLVEASITLDTYADEVISSGLIDDPIRVSVNVGNQGNAAATKLIQETFQRNKVVEHLRSTIRSLCKYGDFGYRLELAEDMSVGSLTFHPTKAPDFIAHVGGDSYTPIQYDVIVDPFITLHREKYHPWEFIQFSLYHDETRPYGKSVLHSMRSAFDQLVTLEALLALTRASKVDRLVIKVPVADSNPVSAFSKLANIKAQFKSIMMNDSLGKRNMGKPASFTDILWMPSGEDYKVEALKSNMDFSTIEDVEYYLNKALRATRLPKGYLIGDGTEQYRSGVALSAQDLKFSRALIPIQEAVERGLSTLALVTLAYGGFDVTNVEVKVKLERPSKLSKDRLEQYDGSLTTASSLVEYWKSIHPEGEQFPVEKYYELLDALGIPEEVVEILRGDNLRPTKKKGPEDITSVGTATLLASPLNPMLKDALVLIGRKQNPLLAESFKALEKRPARRKRRK